MPRVCARTHTRAQQAKTLTTPCVHPEQVPFTSQMLADNMRIVSVPRGFKPADEDEEGGAAFDWGLLHRNILQPFSAETW